MYTNCQILFVIGWKFNIDQVQNAISRLDIRCRILKVGVNGIIQMSAKKIRFTSIQMNSVEP